jgi:hypothetical protein
VNQPDRNRRRILLLESVNLVSDVVSSFFLLVGNDDNIADGESTSIELRIRFPNGIAIKKARQHGDATQRISLTRFDVMRQSLDPPRPVRTYTNEALPVTRLCKGLQVELIQLRAGAGPFSGM